MQLGSIWFLTLRERPNQTLCGFCPLCAHNFFRDFFFFLSWAGAAVDSAPRKFRQLWKHREQPGCPMQAAGGVFFTPRWKEGGVMSLWGWEMVLAPSAGVGLIWEEVSYEADNEGFGCISSAEAALNYLRAGALALLCESSFCMPEAGCLEERHPKIILLLDPGLSSLFLKWSWGAQHPCFPPRTNRLPCHLLQQPVPLKYIICGTSGRYTLGKSFISCTLILLQQHLSMQSLSRSCFSGLFLLRNTEQIKCAEESVLPISKSHMKWEVRPIARVQGSRCMGGKPN